MSTLLILRLSWCIADANQLHVPPNSPCTLPSLPQPCKKHFVRFLGGGGDWLGGGGINRAKMTGETPDVCSDQSDPRVVPEWSLGRVEKSKNGIKSYGYCFLGGFWYVKNRGKNFGGHRKFFAGWNFT